MPCLTNSNLVTFKQKPEDQKVFETFEVQNEKQNKTGKLQSMAIGCFQPERWERWKDGLFIDITISFRS